MKSLMCVAFAGFCLITPISASGNGGTFNTTDVKATGNLVPQRKDRIVLDKELLKIHLAGDMAQVDVTYTLRNTGGRDTVTYGFPIDSPTIPSDSPTDYDDGTTASEDNGVTDYRIEDAGRNLAVVKIIKKPADLGTEHSYVVKAARNWFMTDLEFVRGEIKILHVSYKVKVLGTETGTSKQAFWSRSPLTFLYTLKPSQSWGNGRVGQLDISADVSEIVSAPNSFHVEFPGAASTDSGNEIVWHLKNYDLRNSPDLSISYDNSVQLMNQDVMGRLLPRKYIESIRASSTHAPSSKGFTYGVNNLLDGNLDTAWIDGVPAPGNGEWIEITFKDNVQVDAIGIINGYCKSEQSLEENGEVLQMSVEVYDKSGRRLKFVDDILQNLVSLERTKYSESLKKFPAASAQFVYDGGEGHSVIKKVRLKITGEEQGTKYAEAAIGKLFICGQPKRK